MGLRRREVVLAGRGALKEGTPKPTVKDRIDAAKARQAELARSFFAVAAELKELERLERQARVDEAREIAADDLDRQARALDERAAEPAQRARELRAQAVEREPAPELFSDLDQRRERVQARLEKLWRARARAIVDVRPESEIAKFDGRKQAMDADLDEIERGRQSLVELSAQAAQLRGEAEAEEQRAAALRAEAQEVRERIALLPEIARRMAVKLHDEEKRLQQRAPQRKPTPEHLLVPIGNGLTRDAADGRIYDRHGVPIIEPTK